MPKQTKPLAFSLLFVLVTATFAFAQADKSNFVKTSATAPAAGAKPVITNHPGPSEREQDGYLGPVRRVKTEVAKVSSKGGKFSEGAKTLLENAVYDLKGVKSEYDYFPNAVTAVDATGRETYKYNEKGDISEMTLLQTDGSVAKKETYTYEYDFFGNWTKMTTAVAVLEGSKIIYEPTEVTYRAISYYVDEATMKRLEEESKKNAIVASNPVSNPSPAQPTAPPNNPVTQPNAQPVAAKTPPATPPALQPNKTDAGTGTVAAAGSPKPTNNPANSNAAGPKSESTSGSKAEHPEVANQPAPTINTEQIVKSAPRMLKPVSSGVLNGKALALPMPDYPAVAKQMRTSGTVVVEVVIDETGKVISARALSGPSLLQAAALVAAKQARFAPTTLSGQPVKAIGTINYNFSL